MKQGTRAVAGVIALMGTLAFAGPAAAADRVIAVDGVAKGNADRRVEILVHVPDGQSADAAAERALAGQNAKKAPKPPPEQPQSTSYAPPSPPATAHAPPPFPSQARRDPTSSPALPTSTSP